MNDDKSQNDLEQWRTEIKNIKSNPPLFKIVKDELTKLELWPTDELFLKWLRQKIPTMQRWQPIYKTLKSLLTSMNYWKDKPRGNPKAGYKSGFGKNNVKDKTQ